MKLKHIIFLVIISIAGGAYCQQSVNMGIVSNVTTCDMHIYDDGGPDMPYSAMLNQTLTIYPENNSGRVTITVNYIDIHRSDTLYIYDGTSATGTPMAKINNSNFTNTSNMAYTASMENTSGAITLRFRTVFFSTFFGNHGNGFKLHATCSPLCQNFSIVLDTALCTKLPVLDPDDNHYYIDLCQDEDVQIAAKGIYPANDLNGYHQDDATTNFKWNLNEGVVAGLGIKSINYDFEAPRAYDVSLVAFDTLMCPAEQPITFRVRTSANPVTAIGNIPQLCVNDIFYPSLGASHDSNIVIRNVGDAQAARLSVCDTVFLPDGVSCPPYGTFYRSNVTFTTFENGATITSPNDLLYVRIKMEHSAVEDLKIKIYCPNNQSATILPNPNYTQNSNQPQYFRVNMGRAYKPDASASCNAGQNPMGEPWNYVWSNNTSFGYQYAADNGKLYSTQNFHAQYNPHWEFNVFNFDYFNDTNHSFSVDSSNVAEGTNFYRPYQNFSALVGCPLNGTWYIEIQDMENDDNGYIVEWELALDPQLLPSQWEYEVGIDSIYFETSGVITDYIQPTVAGTIPYKFHVVDEFGCSYETPFAVTVHNVPVVKFGADKTSCDGETVVLKPESIHSNYNYKWNNGLTDNTISVNATGLYSLTATIVNDGEELCSGSDSVFVEFHSNSSTEITDEICSNYDYQLNGFNILSSDFNGELVYYDTLLLTNATGCDSIVALELKILPKKSTAMQKYACLEYTWNGETYTQSGDYFRIFTSSDGCDSVVTLHLELDSPGIYEFENTVCGYYVWDGDTLWQSGDYERHYISMFSCDSIVKMHLTVIDTMLTLTTSNPDFCNTGEATLTASGLNFDNFSWNTGETSHSIEVASSGRYSVTASNEICEHTLSIEVPYCELKFLLPNAITPGNRDGNNDEFSLSEQLKGQIDDFRIVIYNRYGAVVFKSDDKNFVWDGRVNGDVFVNNVYNYVIECTSMIGKPYRKTGSIVVL